MEKLNLNNDNYETTHSNTIHIEVMNELKKTIGEFENENCKLNLEIESIKEKLEQHMSVHTLNEDMKLEINKLKSDITACQATYTHLKEVNETDKDEIEKLKYE